MRLFNNHARYEALVTEHLDGRLDEAGEAKLRKHLESCAECTAEVADQRALLAVLHAEPMVEAPRSFALPYAPRTVEAPHGSRPAGMPYAPGIAGGSVLGFSRVLRSLQMATAAAALVLVFLVGINIVEGPGGLERAGSDAAAAEQLRTAGAEDDGQKDIFNDMGLSAEGGSEDAVEPPPDTLVGPAPSESQQDAPPQVFSQPQASPERTGLEWALIVMSAFTGILALSVVAATWVPRRRT